MERTNCSQLSLSSLMPSATPITSRCPSALTPMATRTLTFSTEPPHERLCHTPSMNTYGYSSSNGLVRHASISPYTFLSLSLRVWDGILSPHGNWLMSSTCRVLTPARYMSMRASSTLSSRLRYRSMTADSKTAPLSLGTFNASLPALAVRLRS